MIPVRIAHTQRTWLTVLGLSVIFLLHGCLQIEVNTGPKQVTGATECSKDDSLPGGCPVPTTVTTPVNTEPTHWRLASNPSQPPPAGSQCTSGSYCQNITSHKCGLGSSAKPCFNWLKNDNSCTCGCNAPAP